MKTVFQVIVILFSGILYGSAQVPVSQEPRHHNVFENKYVRLLDVHIKPGDTSLFHKHEIPSVFIVLTNAKSGSEVISEGNKTNLPVTYGNIWFDGFYTKPRIHRVWNSDTIEFHVMDVELLNKDYQEIDPPLKQKQGKLLFDEKPVRGYLFTLNAQTSLALNQRKAPMLVVGLTDSTGNITVNNKPFEKKGDFLFIPSGSKSILVNKGVRATDLAIFELK